MENKILKLSSDGVELNYVTAGRGTPLLFLHGWGIDCTYWESQLEYFSANYAVYAMDLPGCGKSKADRMDWTIEAYSNDVLAFISALGLKEVILVAHSMAGDIMLEIALRQSGTELAGFVGIDNFKVLDYAFTPEQIRQMNDFIPFMQNDFRNAVGVYADMMLFHPSTEFSVRNRVKNDLQESDPAIAFSSLMNQMQYAETESQKVEQLARKLFLINSDSFPTHEPGLGRHCKAGYHLEVITDCGHYPMLERPTEFNKALEKILALLQAEQT